MPSWTKFGAHLNAIWIIWAPDYCPVYTYGGLSLVEFSETAKTILISWPRTIIIGPCSGVIVEVVE